MAETLAERFFRRFEGLRRAYGQVDNYRLDRRRRKVTGSARTVKEEVTTALFDAHLRGDAALGIVPVDDEGLCHFAAMDVDRYDVDLAELSRIASSLEYPLAVCRSKSGGAHLYAFFSEPLPADLIRERLAEWAVVLRGPVEIFPKQSEIAGSDDVGSWITLPYFAGTKTTRACFAGERKLSPVEFMDLADQIAVDRAAFLAVKVPVDERMKDAPPCLQQLARIGFHEGSRNIALFNLGVFARKKWGDAWEEWVDQLNRAYLDPPLATSEVASVVTSLRKKEYGYKCREAPFIGACNRPICLSRRHGIAGSSSDPGVTLDGLMKVKTEPPTWILNVDGRRVRLDDVRDLLSQERFATYAANAANAIMNPIKVTAWRSILRDLFAKLEEVDAPEEAGREGLFRYLTEQFCVERSTARSREDMLRGRPYIENDHVHFRAADLVEFCEKKRFKIGPKEAWAMLRDMGARPQNFRVKGRIVRTWALEAFDKMEEPFDVPAIPDEDGF